jgi:5-methylcytosine-specific restriction enzyme subunit McrC
MVGLQNQTAQTFNENKSSYIGQIPVRNLWLLMLYASRLMRFINTGKRTIEDNPDDIPDLVAELLSRIVEKRIKRNLTFGYHITQATLNRVRGKIDLLVTESHQLLERGVVSCCFDHLTVNTPRNRYVRAALDSISHIVNDKELGHRCTHLANSLKKLGVIGTKPSRFEIGTDRYSRNDKDDQFMVNAAHLAFDLSLPTEQFGSKTLPIPSREITWIRHLYERAIGGFYDVLLSPEGWYVDTGRYLQWPIGYKSLKIDNVLPSMQTDIILDKPSSGERIVIDTKFNSIFTTGRFREESLRSGYLYQIYAYLRTQEENADLLSKNASGLLLHPSIGNMFDESVFIQGHIIRFATVDLGASAIDIRKQLLNIIKKRVT